MSKVSITYFPIEGAAEKVRLAMKMVGVDFEDKRVNFEEFGAMKPSLPNGSLPVMELDGKTRTQSYAMLRYFGKQGDGSLYPEAKLFDIEEVIGLHEDMARALMPSFMVANRPAMLGYNFANDEEKAAKVKEMRERIVAEDIPKFLGLYSKALEQSGGAFFCGDKPTIADLAILPQIRHLQKGVLDHVPKTIVDGYPALLKWQAAMMEVPQIKEWYAAH